MKTKSLSSKCNEYSETKGESFFSKKLSTLTLNLIHVPKSLAKYDPSSAAFGFYFL